MNSDRALMQQALEALEAALSDGKPYIVQSKDAITALCARLAQPEPEPVAWANKAMELATDFSVESLRLGSYERKDVYENSCRASWQTIDLRHKREAARERLRQHFYAAPPARQWVDLTDEEVLRVLVAGGFTGLRRLSYESGPYDVDVLTTTAVDLYRAISEALKAKNGGTE